MEVPLTRDVLTSRYTGKSCAKYTLITSVGYTKKALSRTRKELCLITLEGVDMCPDIGIDVTSHTFVV